MYTTDPSTTETAITPPPTVLDDLITGWQAELLLSTMYNRIAVAVFRYAPPETVLSVLQEISPLADMRWDCFIPTRADGDDYRQWIEATAKRDQQIADMK